LPQSDESEITSVYAASADDVDKAVIAARNAFNDPSWRDISGTERGDYLFKLARLIDEHKETLATIETWDNGENELPKPNKSYKGYCTGGSVQQIRSIFSFVDTFAMLYDPVQTCCSRRKISRVTWLLSY
jgi:hypothetical protein